MTDKEILKPLVNKIIELSNRPIQEYRKKLWADHQALKKTDKIPVSVYYEGIPRAQWSAMLGQNFISCKGETAREMEFFLKRVIWMAENVPDDHVVWPLVKIVAPVIIKQDWGVKMDDHRAEEELGAYAFAAPLKDGIDISKLKPYAMDVDVQALKVKKEEALDITGGMLDVYTFYHNLEYSPFDVAAKMRGLENIMYDPFDAPDRLHGLIDFLLKAFLDHHKKREQNGWINFHTDKEKKYQPILEYRVHCAHVPERYKEDGVVRLENEWPYLSAQTSSGFGPDMFKEYVFDYYVRMAELFPNKNVYFHGCEPLDAKYPVLKSLPNLRRIHVSPWSSLHKAVEVFQGGAVMEVHAHPAKVLMGMSESEMRDDIRRLVRESEGCSMDLNLSDIHTVNNNPEQLAAWAKIAQEEQ